MNKDKQIDELFKSFKPELNAKRVLTRISGKMDVIDMVRPEQDKMDRFHMTVSACCFIAGLLVGSALMSMVLLHPSGGEATLNLVLLSKRFPGFTLFYIDHRDMILTILAAASFIIGSLPLIYSTEWSKMQ